MKQELIDLAWIASSLAGIAGVAGGWRSRQILAGSFVFVGFAFALWHYVGIR